MNKVGIIGGFGPKTTSEFMLMVISMWKRKKPGTRPELLIWNSDMDEVVEEQFIERNKNHKQMSAQLIKGAKLLEKSGSDFLVLPCNSLHVFINELRKSVKIPVLSILEITATHLVKNKISNIGLIGTEVTLRSKLFSDLLSQNNINITVPERRDQVKINNLITNLVLDKKTSNNDFKKSIFNLKRRGVNNILLACTDLQLIQPHNLKAGFIDTLHLLAQATVDTMLEE